MCFGLKKIIKMFESGNVCITGLRGTGKDLLTSNIIVRRNEPYVANIDYTKGVNYQTLDFNLLDIGKTNYKDFINGIVNYYEYPYIIGSDIYISDVGVYFPSQYCNELNRDYKHFALYQALTRQVSHNNIHINVQNLNRAWDKIREQSDIYIRCNNCIVIGKLVIQSITIYDKYDSAVNRVKPCRISVPLFADKITKQNAKIYIDNFINQHGMVKNKLLIYINKSNYDTYHFEKLLKGGKEND